MPSCSASWEGRLSWRICVESCAGRVAPPASVITLEESKGTAVLITYESELREIELPRWDVPRQNEVIRNLDQEGWCLTNCNDRPLAGRVLRFRRKA